MLAISTADCGMLDFRSLGGFHLMGFRLGWAERAMALQGFGNKKQGTLLRGKKRTELVSRCTYLFMIPHVK